MAFKATPNSVPILPCRSLDNRRHQATRRLKTVDLPDEECLRQLHSLELRDVGGCLPRRLLAKIFGVASAKVGPPERSSLHYLTIPTLHFSIAPPRFPRSLLPLHHPNAVPLAIDRICLQVIAAPDIRLAQLVPWMQRKHFAKLDNRAIELATSVVL